MRSEVYVLFDGGCFPPPEVDLTLHHGLEGFASLILFGFERASDGESARGVPT